MKIEMNKKYRLVDTHQEVRIICVDRKGEHSCVGLFINDGKGYEHFLTCDMEGKCRGQKIVEEIPETDWSKVKVDARIIIDGKHPRHFWQYKDGIVYYFTEGKTSHTTSDVVCRGANGITLVE